MKSKSSKIILDTMRVDRKEENRQKILADWKRRGDDLAARAPVNVHVRHRKGVNFTTRNKPKGDEVVYELIGPDWDGRFRDEAIYGFMNAYGQLMPYHIADSVLFKTWPSAERQLAKWIESKRIIGRKPWVDMSGMRWFEEKDFVRVPVAYRQVDPNQVVKDLAPAAALQRKEQQDRMKQPDTDTDFE